MSDDSNSAEENAPLAAVASGRPVVVIGGGVIGAACAHNLASAGVRVVLIERTTFGSGCSHGNCGFVSPSHVLPLSRPGAVLSTLKLMLQPNSPFQFHLRLDLATWSWMWQFLRRCNVSDMLRAGAARQALLNSSRGLYDSLMSDGTLKNCEWETRGLLFVHRRRDHFEAFAETDRLLKEEFNLSATPLREKELLQREPALKPGIAGAWLYECDAHLRPDRLMDAWYERLKQQGVVIRENCEFIGFESSGQKAIALLTSSGRLEVDQVVVATGAWTRLLKRELGTRVPIEPGKGYSITMRRPSLCPETPMIFEDVRVAITPMASGYRIGSTMEFAGFDTSLRSERLGLLIGGAKAYLREPLTEPFLETWYGWRPMSCDGVPMIGRIPRYNNVWLAAGHSMLGISMAPATGRLIAELVTGQSPHLDPVPYRVDRF